MKLKVFLDLDGVIVDFNRGIYEWYGLDPEKHLPGVWELSKSYPELARGKYLSVCGRKFFNSLHWMPDGRELLGVIEDRFGVDNICLLTSPLSADGCIDGKIDWIKEHIPQYKRRFLIGPEKHYCGGTNCVLIDDKDKNINEFIMAGGCGVLVPRRWNKEHKVKDAVKWVRERVELL